VRSPGSSSMTEPASVHKTIGAELRRIRKIQRLTQRQVGQALGISTRTVRSAENGEGVSLRTLRLYSKLGYDFEISLKGTDSTINSTNTLEGNDK
jgi:transcriptional regulator with XRE-family HTH domain